MGMGMGIGGGSLIFSLNSLFGKCWELTEGVKNRIVVHRLVRELGHGN